MNKEMILKIADIIEQHPETYDQEDWKTVIWEKGRHCGTAYCIAGHAVMLGIRENNPALPVVHLKVEKTEDDIFDFYTSVKNMSEIASELLDIPWFIGMIIFPSVFEPNMGIVPFLRKMTEFENVKELYQFVIEQDNHNAQDNPSQGCTDKEFIKAYIEKYEYSSDQIAYDTKRRRRNSSWDHID